MTTYQDVVSHYTDLQLIGCNLPPMWYYLDQSIDDLPTRYQRAIDWLNEDVDKQESIIIN